ncbi:DUF1819 family protein [Methanomethylophilus alvi]|uniref:DUF1819 family protein n=1 Tax=Methanomethylophilus alvi TaxID=1291540 RepID=UPI0037DC854F
MGGANYYSAAMPESVFVLPETKIVAKMMLDDNDRDRIRATVHDENILNVKTLSNEEKIFSYMYRRLNLISDEMKLVITRGDDTDARFVNLISIMKLDNLFREFVFEVYHECLLNKSPLTDYEIMMFYERKGRENETVASWRDNTLGKLKNRYTRALYASGLIDKSVGIREITTPFVGRGTIDLLRREGYSDYVKATLGI